MARVAALLLLTLALAGCTAEPPTLEGRLPQGPSAPGPGAGAPAGPPPALDLDNLTAEAVVFPAPLWAVGDAWRWSIDGGPGGSSSQQLVVYGESGGDYLVATTDRADAVQTSFFGRSLPGRVSKAWLSGYDQGVPTRYLDFPLQTNKTWTLHVRSTDYAVRANFTRNVEGGRGPGFTVEGMSATGDRIALTYAPSVKWMTRFQLQDPAGGNVFTRTLTAHTANHTGPYYTARVEDLFGGMRNGTAAGALPLDTFTQARPYSLLHLQLQASGSGAGEIRVLDPAGQARYNFTVPIGGGERVEQADLPSLVGGWRVAWAISGAVEVRLRIAGVDVAEGQL